MPRIVPGAYAALMASGKVFPVWLVEIVPISGGASIYLSSGPSVSFNGHSYDGNRLASIDSLTAQFIDYKRREFGAVTAQVRGFADDGSTNLPFVTLEGSEDLEGSAVFVHFYEANTGAGVDAIWQGYVTGRHGDGDVGNSKSYNISGSFLWDSPVLKVPGSTLQQQGFGEVAETGTKKGVVSDTGLPLYYAAEPMLMRPTVYGAKVDGSIFRVNVILSGCAPGQPFDGDEILRARLFEGNDIDPAIDFSHVGLDTDTVPTDLTDYPDGLAHNRVAYASLAFPITDAIKDKLDNIGPDDVKVKLSQGRKLAATGLPSENGVLILQDVLTDPNFGLGMSADDFDADAITAAANIVGTQWQTRLELHDRIPVAEWVQGWLAQINCYITWSGRKLQVKAKHAGEPVVASFGAGGRRIVGDKVNWEVESRESLNNEYDITYRKESRHEREVIVYDNTAQTRGGFRLVNAEDVTFDGLFDPDQVAIAGAIMLREELNANLLIDFECPIIEGLDITPGDLIQVTDPNIPGGVSNLTYRVISQTFTTGTIPTCQFKCKVFKASVYDYSTAGIGVDLIRSGSDESGQGRPPNVLPLTLAVIDKTTGDTGGVMAHIKATFGYPVIDLAADAAIGIHNEYPIKAVQLFWRYTDEPVNTLRLGAEVAYPSTEAHFYVDFIRSASIEVVYVALGINRSHGSLGYEPDLTVRTALTANLSATALTANVLNSAAFAANDYTRTEFEINRLSGALANVLTFIPDAGNRQAFFDSVSIAHPAKTQLAKAIRNYPALTVALARRFTYAIVTGLEAINKGDRVTLRWDDPTDADTPEDFHVFSTTNAALLDSATPDWYFQDPINPPAGILHVVNSDRKMSIYQEDIGGANIPVYVRVAAGNHRNLSSELSDVVSGFSTGTASQITSIPSSPALAFLLSNTVNLDTIAADAKIKARIQADASNPAVTFEDTGATFATAVFRPSSDAAAEPYKAGGVISDLTATFVDVIAILPLGQSWDWTSNILSNDGHKAKSTGPPYTFRTGGLKTIAPGDVDTVPAPTFGTITRNENSNKEDVVPVTITQNGTDIIEFKELYVQKSMNGGAWVNEPKVHLHSEETLYASPTASLTINLSIQRKAAVTAQYRAWVRAKGGKESAVTTSASQGVTPDDGAATPGAVTFPSLPTGSNNTVDGDPEKSNARVTWSIATANSQTFAANNIGSITLAFARLTDAGALDTNSPFTETKTLKGSELSATNALMSIFEPMGQRLRLLAVIASNGDKKTETTGTLDVIAGNVIRVNVGDATTVPAPQFGAITREDGSNKIDLVPVTLAQDGTQIILYKRLVVEVSVNGGAFGVEADIGLKASDSLHASITGSYSQTFRVKRKAGVTAQYRATAYAVGGKPSALTTSGSQTATADDGSLTPGALNFPAVPTGANNTVDGDPAKNNARVTFTLVTTNGQSFAANNIRSLTLHLLKVSPSGVADSTDRIPVGGDLSSQQRAASSINLEALLIMGQAYRALRVVAANGDKATETAGQIDFVGGGVLSVAPADAQIVPAPTFGTIARVDASNKLDSVPVTLTQNGSVIVLYKRLNVQVSINGGAFIDHANVGLKEYDALYASVTGSVTITFQVPRKAGVTAQYRAVAVSVGGKSSAITTSASQSATGTDLSADGSTPSVLGTPIMSYISRLGLHLSGMTVGAGWTQPKAKYIVLRNGTGTVFFDLPTYMTSGGVTVQATSESAARYEIGPGKNRQALEVRKADMQSVLGTTAIAYFYAENVGTSPSVSSASPLSNSITLANVNDIMGARDAVASLDVGTQMGTSNQLLDNGDCIGSVDNGANAGKLKSFGRVTTFAGFTTGGISPVKTNTTTSIAWNQANHSLSVYDKTWFLVCAEIGDSVNLNGMIPEHTMRPGDIFSVGFVAKAPAGGVSGSVRVYPIDEFGTAYYDTQYATIPLTGLSSIYIPFGGKLQTKTASLPGDKILVFDFLLTSGIDATHPLEIDAYMFVRGNTIRAHQARAKIEGVTIPGAVNNVTIPDLGAFGTTQGFFGVGGGGRLTFL